MRPLPRSAWFYIWLVAFSAGAVLLWFFPLNVLSHPEKVVLAMLCVPALIATETHQIPIRNKTSVTVSTAIIFAAILILDIGLAAWATAIGLALAYLRLRRRWYNVLFNTSAYVLTVCGAGLAYRLLDDAAVVLFSSWANTSALLVAGLTYFLVNTVLVATIVDLRERRPLGNSWLTVSSAAGAEYLSMLLLGVVGTLLYDVNKFLLVLIIIPVIIVYDSYKTSMDLREQTKRAIEALSDTIDKRDPYTFQHSRRVVLYAERIAIGLHLDAEQIDLIRTTARVHDLGKIGVSNEMLYKPGPLNHKETDEFRKHPVIGAEIVQRFPQYRAGRELILYHHERFDGTGYPEGLRGDEIPLGARIITVADSFDAMTSDRPYRAALSYETAIGELHHESGSHFDPQVVAAFLEAVAPEDFRTATALKQAVQTTGQP